MSEDAKQAEAALLTEHFRYTPMTLLDEIINTINEVVNRAIDAAEQGLLSTDPAILGFQDRINALKKARNKSKRNGHHKSSTENPDDYNVAETARKEIEEGVYQLETLLNSTIDRVFDKFEIYVLRNLLSIPEELLPWIRLDHYKDLDFKTSEDEPTIESIQELAHKVAETKKLEDALEREARNNGLLLAELEAVISGVADDPQRASQRSLAFLTSSENSKALGLDVGQTSTTKPNGLQTHTSFVISQLGHLEKLLAELRKRLQELPPLSGKLPPNLSPEDDPDVLRKAYIESQTRRAVRRYGMGLAGPGGYIPGLSGATTADMGPSRSSKELDSLEQLAESLGPSKKRPKNG